MLKSSLTGIAVASLLLGGAVAQAQSTEGAAEETQAADDTTMYPTWNIVQNVSRSADHSLLVELVKTADLVTTLSGEGPFTVFAPTNDAFNVFPEGAVDGLKKPENKAILSRILKYHVIPGKVTSEQLIAMIEAGGGSATLTTVEGTELTATIVADKVKLSGSNGTAFVTTADLEQSNGIVHSINGVVVP
ncbi:MAG: fasciclin domain-containing protein [Pseudomonadota bacterium]